MWEYEVTSGTQKTKKSSDMGAGVMLRNKNIRVSSEVVKKVK